MWRFMAGLLQTECESALYPFLQKPQAEPRDLLGTTHLRLLMHCFSELSVIPDHTNLARLKAWLDRRLAQYLLFEGQIGPRRDGLVLGIDKYSENWGSYLGYELEFSEVFLGKILEKGIYLNKQVALETISGRSQISWSLMDKMAGFLRDDTPGELHTSLARACASHVYISLPTTIKLLNDRDHITRFQLGLALSEKNELPEPILQELFPYFKDPFSTSELQNQTSLPPGVVRHLATLLKDSDPEIRLYTLMAFESHSDLVEGIIDGIAAMLHDEDAYVRSHVGWALGTQSKLPKRILEILASQMLIDRNPGTRASMAHALGNQEALPDNIVAVLESGTADNYPFVRETAFSALEKHVHPNDDLFKNIFINSTNHTGSAIGITEQFGRAGSAPPYDILKHFVALIEDADTNVAKNAANALSYNSCLPAGVIDSLLKLLQNSNKTSRHLACLPLSSQETLSGPNLMAIEGHISNFSISPTLVMNLARAKCATLPHGILKWLVPYLDYPFENQKAAEVLTNQKSLPLDILKSLVLHLGSSTIETRHAAEKTLRHTCFHSLLPHLSAEEWVSWLKILRGKFFRESITCFVTEGNLCVRMPGIVIKRKNYIERSKPWTKKWWNRLMAFLNTLALNPRVPRTEYI